MDPAEGIDREGNTVPAHFYFDVGMVMALKRKMLAAHESQRAWPEEAARHGRFPGNHGGVGRSSRGRLCGVEYAEGFRQYAGHAYPRTPLLQELLAPYLRQPLA